MPRIPPKPLEQIVSECGRYPLEAFLFVQECVGTAAEHVHGALTPEQAVVAQWMAREEIPPELLARLYHERRLPPDIGRAVHAMGGPERMNRHVTGQQLCWAIRDEALSRWGLMARSVLARWNILRTEDIGQIIFHLVENDWLQKQPSDRIEDFNNVFSFDEAFDESYQLAGRLQRK
jgi:uncharacterized repeat protein (TIGR04138 family)